MDCNLVSSRLHWSRVAGAVWGLLVAIAPTAAQADVPLTRADVESIQNRVEIIPRGRAARRASLSDWLAIGDALRTAAASRAELRFNDGSLARVGERATFRFVPNTRTFQLSNGTVLMLIPPRRGPSRIRTPSAVTGVQGTALVVRHVPFETTAPQASDQVSELPPADLADCLPESVALRPDDAGEDAPLSLEGSSACSGEAAAIAEQPGRTIVMVLTDNPEGPVEVTTLSGQTASLRAGHMAIVEGDTIQVLEFDLALFYATSPLVEGLELDNPDFEGRGLPTDPVRQETLAGLATQSDFAGRYFLNPDVLTTATQLTPETRWLLPVATLTPGQGAAAGRSLPPAAESWTVFPSDLSPDTASLQPGNPDRIPAGVLSPALPPPAPGSDPSPGGGPALPGNPSEPPPPPPGPPSEPPPFTPPGQENPVPDNTPPATEPETPFVPPGQENPVPENTP